MLIFNHIVRKREAVMKNFVVLLIFLAVLNCKTIVQKQEIKSNNTEKEVSICILYHKSNFRETVVSKLKEKLLEKNVNVIIDDAFKTKEHSPEKYTYVVVFTGIHAFIPDSYPFNYFVKYKKNKNILKIFCTFLTKNSNKKGLTFKENIKNKPDTISLASINSNIDILVDKIIEVLETKKII